jgi:tRNA(Ile)-lysidine synthase
VRPDFAVEAAVADALAPHAGRVLVGFSGGLDSSVLLYAAAQVLADTNRLLAVHINHGLSVHAADWQRHCVSVSSQLGVECRVEAVAVARHGSLEAAARRARYSAFAAALEPGDVLLLGHHLDDQAETVLWRLLRGGGSHALAGIPARRLAGAAILARPLLDFTRAQLRAWAVARDITWIDDDSNAGADPDRNYLRHAVLPALRQRWPDVAQRLVRAMHRSQRAALQSQASVERHLDAALDASRSLAVAPLLGCESAIEMLRHWLARAGVHSVRERVLAEILRQASVASDRLPEIVVAEGHSVRRYRDRLYLTARDGATEFAAVAWRLGETLRLPGGDLRSSRGAHGERSAADVGFIAAAEQVTVRPRRGGERLRLPYGRGSRSVKRLLQEARVPPWQRIAYPLVFVADQLAVVPGIAVDAAFVDMTASAWRIAWQPRVNAAFE